MTSKKLKLGVLGFGKMGEAIAAQIITQKDSPFEVSVTVRSESSAAKILSKYGLKAALMNAEVAGAADVVLVAVKPGQAEAVLKEIQPQLRAEQIVISVCAGLGVQKLKTFCGGKLTQVISAMPNLPAMVGEGMTVYTAGPEVTTDTLATVQKLFSFCGEALQISEAQMDAATGLSGCGPAFVFLMCEALSDAGVKMGLSRVMATQMAAQTLLGSAKMVLQTGLHPGALKDQVTTPGGCTIEGVVALEEGKFRGTVMSAVIAAAQKSEAMRRGT